MKFSITTQLFTVLFTVFISSIGLCSNKSYTPSANFSSSFIKTQTTLDYNNISAWFQNSGTFNQDIRTNNTPGFMWPKGSNRFAIFTSGLSIGGYINGALRLATASYSGEYQPGTINIINGLPNPYTDTTFKIYKVSEGDNCNTNPDWANWGYMIPYGAPYIDANGNYQYDPCIDTPGVAGAGQTLFMCLTDAFPENHSQSEGFSGGTAPMNAEVRITAWAFNNRCVPGLENSQFVRWQIINKNNKAWDKARFSIVVDPDLGDATDDYIGCDTVRQMGYCYNSDNQDGTGNPPTYGQNPPAVGMRFLRSIKNKLSPDAESYGMNSFCYFTGTGAGGVTCEQDPQQPIEAYNFMDGLKKDGTPWVTPSGFIPTKYTFPGNPVTLNGWTELGTNGIDTLGTVLNCGGNLTGTVYSSPAGDRRFVMSTGKDNLIVNPLDTHEIIITQLMGKGSNNLNAVIKLLNYSDMVAQVFPVIFHDENPVIPVNILPDPNSIAPTSFYLSNNYPNPFNPVTKIKYGVPYDYQVSIIVYDILGNEVQVLQNGIQSEGNYELEFNGSSLPSGVYYLRMKAGGFIVTRKMLLIK